jgi:hypothetical protein
MTFFTYVTRWDHGFAPNPFHEYCTLATCKPGIRKKAVVGDWILGTGSAERDYDGKAIFLMRVGEMSTFDEYWIDPRFRAKRPVLNGSFKLRFGDNIYHRKNGKGAWIQADSRHSRHGAATNAFNLKRDTSTTDKVLIGTDFTYWGDSAPQIPARFKRFCIDRPGYYYDFSAAEIEGFLKWALGLNQHGRVGDPVEWRFARWWR